MSNDIVARLHAARRVHPQATLPWPHEMLADAAAEIERLRAERDALKTAARNYLEVLGAAMAAGTFHMGGSRDMAHFVRAAMQQLDVLAFDRDEKRPTGLEKLHEEIVKGKERHQG